MHRAGCRDELETLTQGWRREGARIALVPTMVVRAARAVAARVVCSVYVNPAQFGQGEDFESYPRTLESDRRMLEHAQCDLLFAPGDETMYPFGPANAVCLKASPSLSDILEGASRPGHFDGVVTVVARLFNLVRPDSAVFGEKDYQQLLVISRLVEDLSYPIRIVSVPTVREAGGLAMSSRNNYLEPPQREAAAKLYEVLQRTAGKILEGGTELADLEKAAQAELGLCGFTVDYFSIHQAADLARARTRNGDLRVLTAVWSGKTRLIDNILVDRVGI
jgi:pantoate--beta-alanine ligase